MQQNEEILEQNITEEVSTPETTVPEVKPQEEVIKNYEELVKQQQEQINQLLKQQEMNKKMYQQLSQANKQFQELNKGAEDNTHWVDKAIQKNFKVDFPNYDPEDIFYGKKNTEHLATWYIQYLKNQGCSNDEISKRMANIFKHVEKMKQTESF